MQRSPESRIAMHRLRDWMYFRRDKMRSEERTSPRHSLGKEKKRKVREREDLRIAEDEKNEHNISARAHANGYDSTALDIATPIHALMPGERRTLFDIRDASPTRNFIIERS